MIESYEHLRQRNWCPCENGRERPDCLLRALSIALHPAQLREAQEIERSNRIRGGSAPSLSSFIRSSTLLSSPLVLK